MRKFIINVNGNSYEVEVEEVGGDSSTASVSSKPVAKPAPKPAAKAVQKQDPAPKPAPKAEPKKEVTVSAGQETIEAPMPGNIWKVLVKEGDAVNEGDVLLILEAMKMENEIVAPRGGTVSAIVVNEGTTVSAGEKLVVLD